MRKYSNIMDETALKDAIRNDLRRVSKWAAQIDQALPEAPVDALIHHAQKLSSQLTDPDSRALASELRQLAVKASFRNLDLISRLRWAEKILTLSCQL